MNPATSNRQVFHKALEGRCVRPDGSRALVLDVGANFGWFSLYAAKLGCRCGAVHLLLLAYNN